MVESRLSFFIQSHTVVALRFSFSPNSSHRLPSDNVLKELSVVESLEVWDIETGTVRRRFTF